MKRIVFWSLAFGLHLGLLAQVEDLPKLKLDSGRYQLGDENLPFAYVQAAKILFQADDGYPAGSNETYLLFFDQDGYVVIADSFVGHSVEFDMHDLDGDREGELIVYYASGGNQKLVRVYQFRRDGVALVESEVTSSNLGSINVRDGFIVVENQRRISEKTASLMVERFGLKDGRIVLVEESEEVIRE